MSDKIFELAKQAGLQPYYYAQEQHIQRFAELLVKKCISMADEFEMDVNRSGLVDKMKVHFGVEE